MPLSPQNRTFDRFLFAPIVEHDGLPLSVLSALAREGLDPWQEAERLGRLPHDEAIDSLAVTIWRSNSKALSPTQAGILAARLVELLPAEKAAPSSRQPAADADLIVMLLVYGIFMGIAAISSSPSSRQAQDLAAQSLLSTTAPSPPTGATDVD